MFHDWFEVLHADFIVHMHIVHFFSFMDVKWHELDICENLEQPFS